MKKYCVLIPILLTGILCAVITGRLCKNAFYEYAGEINQAELPTVILDAGHGGEDSGAVAPDGTLEKDINLEISNGVAACFELFGIPYIPVRTDDRSVCDEGLVTIRERKKSDIMNRYELICGQPDGILLSIHQNFFTESRYSGAQIFYAPESEASKQLAKSIKLSVTAALQPQNQREIKPGDQGVFVLYLVK